MAVNFAARLARLKKDRKVLLAQVQRITRDLAEVEQDIDATEAEIGKAPCVDPAPRKAASPGVALRQLRDAENCVDPAARKVATPRKPRAKK